MIHYGQLPLSFEPNRGQTSSNVQWLARGPEYTLFLTGNDAVLEMNKITPAKRDSADPKDLKPSISSSVMRMSLIGARTPEQAAGEDLQSGKANYFTGNDPAKWQHDVPMYGKVHMQGVYPGVDLKYYGHRGELEYDFVVAPGADPAAIRLRFDGAKPTLAANGDLVLPVEGGPEVRFNKPVVYQTVDGVRQPVTGSFVIADNKAGQLPTGSLRPQPRADHRSHAAVRWRFWHGQLRDAGYRHGRGCVRRDHPHRRNQRRKFARNHKRISDHLQSGLYDCGSQQLRPMRRIFRGVPRFGIHN
jgi:hypothetical protein